MTSIAIAVIVAVLTFAAGFVGLFLQKLLPEQHTSERSRDMIGAVTGLVTLLLALVLGTLIASGYSLFSTQKSELETLATRAIQLDMALAQYGPEAQPGRVALKKALTRGYELFWVGDPDPNALGVAAAVPGLQGLSEYLNALDPKTPMQKQLLSSAIEDLGSIASTRLQMSLQLANPFPWPLLIIVVSWSLLLFCGYGLLSRMNAMTLAALAFGAFSVSSAIFLNLELRQPYSGFVRIPPAALVQAIEAVNK